MESYQGSVCGTRGIPVHMTDGRGQKGKQVGSPDADEPQFTSSLSMGLRALLFPSWAECFPKESGTYNRMCITPQRNLKQKQHKKRNFPACALH